MVKTTSVAVTPAVLSPVSLTPTTFVISIETSLPSIAYSSSITSTIPSNMSKSIFHGGVGVSTNTGIWVCQAVVVEDYAGQVLNVYLVNNAGSWRNNLEVGEVLCTPTQELVALFVALVLNLNVLLQSISGTECLSNDRVVNNHLSWVQWVDLIWGTAQSRYSLTHGCQVDNTWDTSEVLHKNTSWGELDFSIRLSLWIPVRQSLDVLFGYVLTVFGAKQVLRQDL